MKNAIIYIFFLTLVFCNVCSNINTYNTTQIYDIIDYNIRHVNQTEFEKIIQELLDSDIPSCKIIYAKEDLEVPSNVLFKGKEFEFYYKGVEIELEGGGNRIVKGDVFYLCGYSRRIYYGIEFEIRTPIFISKLYGCLPFSRFVLDTNVYFTDKIIRNGFILLKSNKGTPKVCNYKNKVVIGKIKKIKILDYLFQLW
jgi:hypothetical protein